MTNNNPPDFERRSGYGLLLNILLIVLTVGCLVAAALFPLIARAAETTPPAVPPPALTDALNKIVTQDGAPGVTLLVFHHGQLLYRIDRGAIAADAQLPVASASKWLTAALVMTLVDDGKLSLDEPIGQKLPEFTGAAGQITLRQILSYTSGQGGLKGLSDVRQDPRITLRDSARQIAALPLQDPPGTVFKYGSPAFQIAGALAESVTGKSWSALFQERIAGPLGMAHTMWGNPLRPDIAPADVRNPNLQGGAVTTAEDYGRFLTMLAADGVYGGKRILSHASVTAMETAATGGLAHAFLPPGGEHAGLQYALGNWCEVADKDGGCAVVSSPGALGTYPWIDRRNDLYGVFFMRRRLPLVEKDVQEAQRIIERTAADHPILP